MLRSYYYNKFPLVAVDIVWKDSMYRIDFFDISYRKFRYIGYRGFDNWNIKLSIYRKIEISICRCIELSMYRVELILPSVPFTYADRYSTKASVYQISKWYRILVLLITGIVSIPNTTVLHAYRVKRFVHGTLKGSRDTMVDLSLIHI